MTGREGIYNMGGPESNLCSESEVCVVCSGLSGDSAEGKLILCVYMHCVMLQRYLLQIHSERLLSEDCFL